MPCKNYNLNSREKFEPGPGFESRTFRSLALSHLSYRGSIDGTVLNFSTKSNDIQVQIFLLNYNLCLGKFKLSDLKRKI